MFSVELLGTKASSVRVTACHAQPWSATQPYVAACLLPAGRVRERTGRVKVRKYVCWNKDSLVGIAKATHTSKAGQGIHSPLPTAKQVLSHLQESRASSCVTAVGEDRLHDSECPSFPPFPLALYVEHDAM